MRMSVIDSIRKKRIDFPLKELNVFSTSHGRSLLELRLKEERWYQSGRVEFMMRIVHDSPPNRFVSSLNCNVSMMVRHEESIRFTGDDGKTKTQSPGWPESGKHRIVITNHFQLGIVSANASVCGKLCQTRGCKNEVDTFQEPFLGYFSFYVR